MSNDFFYEAQIFLFCFAPLVYGVIIASYLIIEWFKKRRKKNEIINSNKPNDHE